MHPELGVTGDNDPVDVVEIGSRAHRQGQVTRVRVLGALAMIDDGELDWKVIAIDPSDPEAHGLKSVEDLEDRMPEALGTCGGGGDRHRAPNGAGEHGLEVCTALRGATWAYIAYVLFTYTACLSQRDAQVIRCLLAHHVTAAASHIVVFGRLAPQSGGC